jgi:hypothetical protein
MLTLAAMTRVNAAHPCTRRHDSDVFLPLSTITPGSISHGHEHSDCLLTTTSSVLRSLPYLDNHAPSLQRDTWRQAGCKPLGPSLRLSNTFLPWMQWLAHTGGENCKRCEGTALIPFYVLVLCAQMKRFSLKFACVLVELACLLSILLPCVRVRPRVYTSMCARASVCDVCDTER